MMTFFCETAGTRTQGPYIKSVLLYQLSYDFLSTVFLRECKNKEFSFSSKEKSELFLQHE